MNDKILSKMERIALQTNHKIRGDTSTTILTLFRCMTAVSFLSLIVVNSLGFGLGFSNMKIYQDVKSNGYLDARADYIHSKCLPPHNNLIKYFIQIMM